MHKDPMFEALPAVLHKMKQGQDVLAAVRQIIKKPSPVKAEKAEADRRLALLRK